MVKPKKPANEATRLERLKSLDILDTPSEERFDRLTRLATRLFNMPIALVSLVDENRQWFKSCQGLGVSETPRDISFCGHAILGDDVFVINDASRDPRFADNPLVINEPRIRFYAGCPLKYLDGSTLGTLCIIDHVPRDLDDGDLTALKDLASIAERELTAIKLATIDELTQAPNRRGFLANGQQSLKLCVRENIPVSLAYMDLNNFKPINDAFGHAEGDRVLVDFSHQIGVACRETDMYARIGGDEFAILFINATKSSARDAIVRLQRALEEYNKRHGRGYEISFSYGIVDFKPRIHDSINKLLEDGDIEMYEFKRNSG